MRFKEFFDKEVATFFCPRGQVHLHRSQGGFVLKDSWDKPIKEYSSDVTVEEILRDGCKAFTKEPYSGYPTEPTPDEVDDYASRLRTR